MATGQGSRQRGTYSRGAVVRITESSAAAVIFDVAGSQGGSPASTFVANMTNKFGGPRRSLFAAADQVGQKAADQAGERAANLLVSITQRKLD